MGSGAFGVTGAITYPRYYSVSLPGLKRAEIITFIV